MTTLHQGLMYYATSRFRAGLSRVYPEGKVIGLVYEQLTSLEIDRRVKPDKKVFTSLTTH